MHYGVIKWFDSSRGEGLIAPSNGGDDVIVHIDALRASGLTALEPGTRVRYDVFVEPYRNIADNLVVC